MMAGNSWKLQEWLEMAEDGSKWLEISGMAEEG